MNFSTLNTIHLEVTKKCNHHCLFCPQHEERMQVLAPVVLGHLDPVLANIQHWILGGGEAFCWPHLKSLVETALERNPRTTASIVTNGTLFSPYWREMVLRGFFRKFNISFNATTPETYRAIHGRDDYEKAMEGIEFLSAHRRQLKYRLEVSMVLSKSLVGGLAPHVAKLAGKVDRIVFQEICRYPSIVDYFEQEKLTPEILGGLQAELDTCASLARAKGTDLVVLAFSPLRLTPPVPGNPAAKPVVNPLLTTTCPLPWSEVMINVVGNVMLGCCNTSKKIGNIVDQPLAEILQNEMIARIQSQVLKRNFDACAAPRLRHKCPFIAAESLAPAAVAAA